MPKFDIPEFSKQNLTSVLRIFDQLGSEKYQIFQNIFKSQAVKNSFVTYVFLNCIVPYIQIILSLPFSFRFHIIHIMRYWRGLGSFSSRWAWPSFWNYCYVTMRLRHFKIRHISRRSGQIISVWHCSCAFGPSNFKISWTITTSIHMQHFQRCLKNKKIEVIVDQCQLLHMFCQINPL